jgi:hypothetical protein
MLTGLVVYGNCTIESSGIVLTVRQVDAALKGVFKVDGLAWSRNRCRI